MDMKQNRLGVDLADNLRYFRRLHGYSQAKVSDLLHVCRSTYAHYEAGKRLPDLDILLALADLYHISLDTLLQSKERRMTAFAADMLQNQEAIPQLVYTYLQLSDTGRAMLFEHIQLLLQEERESGEGQAVFIR